MRKTIPLLALVVLAVTIPAVASDMFTDVPDSNIFHDDIGWLADEGVTRGCNPPDNTEFCPGDNVTREQMAAFLHRLSGSVLTDAAVGGTTSLEAELAAANLGTAAYQDVAAAEPDGYASTLGPGEGSLGCFEDPAQGGMGVHYLRADLLDATLDASQPEALVYELDASGVVTGLVAHEYIVPVAAWTGTEPPMLFGQHLHQHSVLPLYVLHAWIWKANPSGMFEDYNPAVRLCPDGVPVFGE
ncbi:MAG: S-layer homology domain-containing protein [Acidimicrobiia bacterium]